MVDNSEIEKVKDLILFLKSNGIKNFTSSVLGFTVEFGDSVPVLPQRTERLDLSNLHSEGDDEEDDESLDAEFKKLFAKMNDEVK